LSKDSIARSEQSQHAKVSRPKRTSSREKKIAAWRRILSVIPLHWVAAVAAVVLALALMGGGVNIDRVDIRF
jgi:hypothetical protein